MKRLLLTDYGGVLAKHHQEPAESILADKIGVSVVPCRELLNERSTQGMAVREGRVSESEFWDDVFRLAASSRRSCDVKHLTRLWAETYRLDPTVLSLLGEVRQATPVGVLTNIDAGRSEYLVSVIGITALVDVYLPSYKYRAIKPKEALWEAATAAIEKELGNVQVTYIDDREEHILACVAHEWVGIQYVGVESLRHHLEKQGFLMERK